MKPRISYYRFIQIRFDPGFNSALLVVVDDLSFGILIDFKISGLNCFVRFHFRNFIGQKTFKSLH